MSSEIFEVNCGVVSKFIIDTILPITKCIGYPLTDLMLMVGAIYRIQPKHIIEWGTNIGRSARIFYETTKHLNINCDIHSIDLPDDITHVEHPTIYRATMIQDLPINLYYGDGLEQALNIAKNMSGNILFFVDGDHSYNSVYNEVSSLIKYFPNENILIHDTFFQCNQSGYNIGPYAAVQKALTDNDHTYSKFELNMGGPGMTLLYHLPIIDKKNIGIEWI